MWTSPLSSHQPQKDAVHPHYSKSDAFTDNAHSVFTSFQSTNKHGIWIFGFGSLVHTPGFEHGEVVDGLIKGYRRVWWQNSTDHRGTPEAPGRVVTLQRTSDDVVTVCTCYI